MPIRTIAPGTPAGGTPLRAYEIDLAGSGGTLSNGTVSLGGTTGRSRASVRRR